MRSNFSNLFICCRKLRKEWVGEWIIADKWRKFTPTQSTAATAQNCNEQFWVCARSDSWLLVNLVYFLCTIRKTAYVCECVCLGQLGNTMRYSTATDGVHRSLISSAICMSKKSALLRWVSQILQMCNEFLPHIIHLPKKKKTNHWLA